MMGEDNTNGDIHAMEDYRDRLRFRFSGSSGDSGGPTDMEPRIKALEDGFRLIVGKLDGIADDIRNQRLEIKDLRNENEKRFGGIEGRLIGIEKTLDAKAAKSDLTPVETKLGTVEGVVKNLPGTPTLITLVLSAVALSLGGAAGLAFTLFKIFGGSSH